MKKIYYILASIVISVALISTWVKANATNSFLTSIEKHAIHSGEETCLEEEQTVYICTGPKSKRYHKSTSCRGFNNCSGSVRAVTISKAQSLRRTPCKWCYK